MKAIKNAQEFIDFFNHTGMIRSLNTHIHKFTKLKKQSGMWICSCGEVVESM